MTNSTLWDSKATYRGFEEKLAPETPTHFITINLAPPSSISGSPVDFNRNTASQRTGLPKQIVNRIDRGIYGSSHRKKPVNVKFPFLMISETRDKRARVVPCHYHLVLDIGDKATVLRDRWPSIHSNIDKLVAKFGFYPDVDIRPADSDIVDYLLKNSVFDSESVYTRDNQKA